MANQELAILEITPSSQGGGNTFAFKLDAPGKKLPQMFGHLPEGNVENIKVAIQKAAELMHSSLGMNKLIDMGQMLYDDLVPPEIGAALAALEYPVWLYSPDSTVPWELCHDGSAFWCVRLMMGRMAEYGQAVGKPAVVDSARKLECLILAPASENDLPNAHREALELRDFFKQQNANVDCFLDTQASYTEVILTLKNNHYDLIHVCGHAEFIEDTEPAILLTADQALDGKRIARTLKGSPLVFVNACRSGRSEARSNARAAPTYYGRTLGLPHSFLNAQNGGAIAYIGTPWQIRDVEASQFALAFYKAFFEGNTIGEALRQARELRREQDSATWASFILWGAPTLRLRVPDSPPDGFQPLAPLVEPSLVQDKEIGRKEPVQTTQEDNQPSIAIQVTLPQPIPALFEQGRLNVQRLDLTAVEILHDAEMEMAFSENDFITTSHLFIGLTKVEGGIVETALRHQGFNPGDTRDVLRGHAVGQAVQRALTSYLASGDDAAPDRQEGGVSFSMSVSRILEIADQLAAAQDLARGLITEKHLLAAFLEQGGGTTSSLLERWGLNWNGVRAALEDKPFPAARHPLFDEHAQLDQARLAPNLLQALWTARRRTAIGTMNYLATPDLVDALLDVTPSFADGLRAQYIEPDKIHQLFRPGDGDLVGELPAPLTLALSDVSRRVQNILRLAERESKTRGATQVSAEHALLGFFRDGGGSTMERLEKFPVALAPLQVFILRKHFGEEGILFLPSGHLNLDLFDSSGRQVLELAWQEGQLMQQVGFDTRRLVLALVEYEGAFAAALARQNVTAEGLRRALTGGQPMRPMRGIPLPLNITRRNLSQTIVSIFEQAWSLARGRGMVGERELAHAFLDLGARWTGGGLAQLGIDVVRLRQDLDADGGAAPSANAGAAPTAQPRTETKTKAPPPVEPSDDVFLSDGMLNRARFSPDALKLLVQALNETRNLNHSQIGTPHLTLAIARVPTLKVELEQLGVRGELIEPAMYQRFPPAPPLPQLPAAQLTRTGCSPTLVQVLRLANDKARAAGAAIDERALLNAFLAHGGGHAGKVLEQIGLDRRAAALNAGKTLPTPTLDQFGTDLTEQARRGKLAAVFGREREIQQMQRALAMLTKNNPLLVGEAGVGKTAIVEGLAEAIARGDIAAPLRDKRIVQLRVGDLVAGTMYRGQMEQRIQQLLQEAAQPNVILFIDEIHTLVKAGAADGAALDLGNLFKPALARGDMRVIGATTPDEASRSIEKDDALARRFYRIDVAEPSAAETLDILRQLRADRSAHYRVTIQDDALDAAVHLTQRYIPDRRFPDKAIEALDRACAQIMTDKRETKIVDANAIAVAVSEWRQVPVPRGAAEPQEPLKELQAALQVRIVGQPEAIDAVIQALTRDRAGLREATRPLAVLLFVGPTGVGKTEMALALAEALHGTRDALLRLDMTEFQEPHTLSKLIGAPPGFVGYEEEGQLTGPLRRRPASVVLLDEIDKIQNNQTVLNLFLQLFSAGVLHDGQGRKIDGTHAFFILTANVASDLTRQQLGFNSASADPQQTFRVQAQAALKKYFREDFLNRLDDIVIFRALTRDDCRILVERQLAALQTRLKQQRGLELTWTPQVVEFLLDAGFSATYGARELQRALQQHVLFPLSQALMQGTREKRIELRVVEGAIAPTAR